MVSATGGGKDEQVVDQGEVTTASLPRLHFLPFHQGRGDLGLFTRAYPVGDPSPRTSGFFLVSDDFGAFLPVDHHELVAGCMARQIPR